MNTFACVLQGVAIVTAVTLLTGLAADGGFAFQTVAGEPVAPAAGSHLLVVVAMATLARTSNH